ncbi:D-aminoacyl-tRNA deacylase [Caldivirga sp. UBA161]|uniref:D-aminoacyl-tRNA deacylase n=1 Tax=Caldivirga sp. UBA161 TaxID=1915569 RepID=UPI0025BEA826|nr:D-aminoacyl-tRNA deacylase [Caldivirga sp. UBA161]
MKIGLVVSRVDEASMGIWSMLNNMVKFREVNANEYLSDLALALVSSKDIVYVDEADEWAKVNGVGLLLFLSRHEMRNPKPLITFHTPGNWTNEVELGGKPSQVAISEPRALTNLFREAYRRISELEGYSATLEATHHGPFVNRPAIFVEIGSTSNEWRDPKAQEFLASLVFDFLNNISRYINDDKDVAVSIGDLHYTTLINHIINGEYDVGHMVPKYVKPTPTIVRMAVERNNVKPRLGIIHWKSLDAESRVMVEEELSSLGLTVIKRR